MGDFPSDWINDIKGEDTFPPPPRMVDEFLDRDGNEDLRQSYDASLEAGLTHDWAMLLADADAPSSPADWDSLTARYDHGAEAWDVVITDDNGNQHVIEDIEWADLIWLDIWMACDDYDVDKEVEY